jgi:glycosyltransferase involved in cell wall biosynthesis
MPLVTFYTCAYNAEKYIKDAIESVQEQNIYGESEYIIIDDFSDDSTFKIISELAALDSRIKVKRNPKNVGLATTSNLALKMARGKYIVRLDADDYFTKYASVSKMICFLKENSLDVVYPCNFYGSDVVTQNGNEQHHVGGALFSTRAINFVRFTDGLRGYEGLDVWNRARNSLKVGYLQEPLFFYRQHDESLSKNNLEQRKLIKEKLNEQSY